MNIENSLEAIDLDLEEENEILFKVKIEGIDQAPTKIRLVCECKDISYVFKGISASVDTVQITLPILKDCLKVGIYSSYVEVIIGNHYFSPLKFNINFKRSLTVIASTTSIKKTTSVVTVSAAKLEDFYKRNHL